MSLKEATKKTAAWAGINIVFGLAQYFVLVSGSALKFGEFTKKETIAEGILMFFCTAMMGAVSADYVIANINYHLGYIIKIAPYFILAIVVYLYSQIHYIHKADFPVNMLDNIQWGIIIVTAVYCVLVKLFIFRRES